MQPNKALGFEACGQGNHRRMNHPTLSAGMNAHVIALGSDLVDFGAIDAYHAIVAGRPN
jgi:hypothetical protein